MDMDLAVYITVGLTFVIYGVLISVQNILFLPGGLAKFHSLLSGNLSCLFILASLFTFLDRVSIGENGSHTLIPFMFNALLFLAQVAYYHAVWDYLRLDNFIASIQIWTVIGYNFFLFMASFVEFHWTRAICIVMALVMLILWVGQACFFRHRIGHREGVVIFIFTLFSILYGIFIIIGPTGFNLLAFWVEVLIFCAIFVFVHIPGVTLTYWWDNLTVGIDELPWFAYVYGYNHMNVKPTTEMVRRILKNVGKNSSSRVQGEKSNV